MVPLFLGAGFPLRNTKRYQKKEVPFFARVSGVWYIDQLGEQARLFSGSPSDMAGALPTALRSHVISLQHFAK